MASPPSSLITLQNADLAFGHVPLLKKAELSVVEGERIGLIGRNGTGKSSLLKILSGTQRLDDGALVFRGGVKLSYVSQEPEFGTAQTVEQAVNQAFVEELELQSRYETLSQQASLSPEALTELSKLQEAIEAADVWQIPNRVDEIIRRCSLEPQILISSLSGGQRKRAALARALVSRPDVLMLDEPTNHLDLSATQWLETLLTQFAGSVIVVTHDRAFLDKVVTRIVELDRGILRSFPGNFATYQERKAEQLHAESLANDRFDKMLAQEEIWIRKGVEARRTRNEGRVLRLKQMRSERVQRLDRSGNVQMAASVAERSGALVAQLDKVGFAYSAESANLVQDFDALIMRGDKVGLIGDNGVGKSTLLKLILGQLKPTAGNLKTGSKLEIAYFDQMRGALDEQATLAETIAPGSEWIEINGKRQHVMSYLGDFLFAPERARSPVRSLSGGERNRLLLARLFASPSNLLVLDEPTNDLDLESLDLLEELLIDYPGTVLLVSHDRRFLDNVVTQSIAHIGDGHWWSITGGYTDWIQQAPALKAKLALSKSDPLKSLNIGDIKNTAQISGEKPKPIKRSYKEQRLLEQIPKQIDSLEAEQKQLQALIDAGDIFVKDPEKAQEITVRHSAIEEELLQLLEQWEQLQA